RDARSQTRRDARSQTRRDARSQTRHGVSLRSDSVRPRRGGLVRLFRLAAGVCRERTARRHPIARGWRRSNDGRRVSALLRSISRLWNRERPSVTIAERAHPGAGLMKTPTQGIVLLTLSPFAPRKNVLSRSEGRQIRRFSSAHP